MDDERLRELERLCNCQPHTIILEDASELTDMIAEIRRLQAELTEVQIDRNNYELLNRLKIVTIEKHEAELARLRPVFEAAKEIVMACYDLDANVPFGPLFDAVAAAKAKEE